MAQAKRDENQVTTLLAVSSADGVTPVTLYANATTHRLLVSAAAGSLDDISDVVITSGAQGDILYHNGTNWVNLAAGTNGHFLKTQGAAANPTWAAATAGAAGTDTQVQFNDGGVNLGGDAGFVYNKTSNVATIGGLLVSGLTASEIVITDASKNLVSAAVATYPSLTELTYLKGVTSAIQTQINTKAPSTAPTFATSITGSYLTASEILITDGSKNIVSAAVATYPSLTELTYVKGVTSALQTQLNAKAPLASPTFTGTVTIPVALTGVVRADSGVLSIDSDVTDIVAAASSSAAGKVELATDAETVTGSDTARATTPANITAKMAAPGAIGGTTPANITGLVIQANTGFIPDANDGAYLGTTTAQFSDLFLAEGGVINWDNGDATITQTGNDITVAGITTFGVGTSTAVTLGTIELGAASDTTLARSAAGEMTLEGVRVLTTTPKVLAAASYTTDTGTSLNMDNLDHFVITAQAGALLFNAPGGTLVQGRSLVIRIKDSGTARALTWNAVFRAMGTALPSTTVISKTLYLGFFYNSTDTKWDLVASAQEA